MNNKQHFNLKNKNLDNLHSEHVLFQYNENQ